MPVIINGTTGLSGVSTVNLANGSVTQNILGNGVAGTGPAFSAYRTAPQTGVTTGSFTKVQLNTEAFDTNNCFDNTTNYRFTPTVAGYYHFSYCVLVAGTGIYAAACQLYINGSLISYGNYCDQPVGGVISSGSSIVYMNGTTDYAELYAVGTVTSGTVTFGSGANTPQFVRFSGALVRAA